MCASIMGSGELGALAGEGGPPPVVQEWGAPPRNSRLFFSRFISSRRLLAICSGVRADSLNSGGEGVEEQDLVVSFLSSFFSDYRDYRVAAQ